MEQLIKTLIYLHIVAGTIALVAGPLSIANKKGGKQHRLTGKLFFYAMMIVALSAIIIAATPSHRSPFLLIIGVFSAYLVTSGYRILYLKGLAKNQRPQLLDWGITAIMAYFAIYFVFTGLAEVATVNSSISIVSVVFGAIALSLVVKDIINYTKRPTDKSFWLYEHISRMIGGNIAAFTAFLVVNNTLLPPVVAWLAPTVIGSFLIGYYIRKYKISAKAGEAMPKQKILQPADATE